MRWVLQLLSLLSLPLAAASPVWEVGKVLDASQMKSTVETGGTINATSTTVGSVAQSTGRVDTQSTTVTTTNLVILGSAYAYTISDTRAQDSLVPHAGMVHTAIIQAVGNRHHGCRFVVNDDVRFYQDKNTLHVIDADGKECKTDIIRQERVPTEQPAAQTKTRVSTTRDERPNPIEEGRADLGERPTLKLGQAATAQDERPTLKLDQPPDANAGGAPDRALRQAAEQGDARAQVNLGLMYERGDGVPKDGREAAQWYRRAAEHGEAMGQNNLGVMYERGDGVPKDLVFAYMWFNLSAAQGVELARSNRDLVEKQMTRDQIADGQRLSREWKPVR